MTEQRAEGASRRRFLVDVAGLGATSLLGLPRTATAESPPETGRVRIVKAPAICLAPLYLAEALLQAEGFSEVRYVPIEQNKDPDLLVGNLADLSACAPPNLLPYLDAGMPIVALAALHGGCYELFVNERVRAVRDLKGRRVAVSAMDALEYYYVASMAAYVGLNPLKDIEWVDVKSFDGVLNAFIDGKADAILAFPPQPQMLRAKKIGRVIVNTALDRPWNQYFCCMSRRARNSSRQTLSRPSGRFAPSSRPPTYAQGNLNARRGTSWKEDTSRNTKWPSRWSARSPTTGGEPTTRRIPCGSSASGSTRVD